MRGARSYPGESTTTNNVRTAVWDTKHRKSSRRRRQPASTQLSERQGTQTPSLAPRAPPSRLKPRMEEQKAVVFLRERIWGAGQSNASSPDRCHTSAIPQLEPGDPAPQPAACKQPSPKLELHSNANFASSRTPASGRLCVDTLSDQW